MKKIKILTILFCVFSLIKVNAQISIGPKLGLNISTISDFSYFKQKYIGVGSYSNTGLNFGCILNIGINDKCSLQTEILYSQKGYMVGYLYASSGGVIPTVDEIKIAYSYNYIEIPLLAKVSFGGNNFKGFVNIGPYLGYALNFTSEDALRWNPPIYTSYDIPNRLDIGLAAGVGVAFKFRHSNLLAEIRYDIGLTNTIQLESSETSGANRCFMLSIAYLFN